MRLTVRDFVSHFSDAMSGEELREGFFGLRRFLIDVRDRGGLLAVVGNGASSSIASTIAFKLAAEQQIRAVALTDHNLLLGFSRKKNFASWISLAASQILSEQDSVLFVSSSGESPNVVAAAKSLRHLGLPSFSLTGFSARNSLREVSNDSLWLDSSNYNVVESAHLIAALLGALGSSVSLEAYSTLIDETLDEIKNFYWSSIFQSLDAFCSRISNCRGKGNRLLFVGDGSSSSLASHLATDFSKSGFLATSINDHNFLSMAQNDLAEEDWLFEGVRRASRPGDYVVLVSHGAHFPAETKLAVRVGELGVEFEHHGSKKISGAFNFPQTIYATQNPVLELSMPSLGLLGVAESFL